MKHVLATVTLGLFTAGLAMATPALASGKHHHPNRERHQLQRIHQGVESGALTRPEARRLLKEQRHLRRERRRFFADGRLTPVERAKLHHDRDVASWHIFREKHDRQRRD